MQSFGNYIYGGRESGIEGKFEQIRIDPEPEI